MVASCWYSCDVRLGAAIFDSQRVGTFMLLVMLLLPGVAGVFWWGWCRVLGELGSLKGSECGLTGSFIQKYKQADLFLSKGNSTTNSSGSAGFPTFVEQAQVYSIYYTVL